MHRWQKAILVCNYRIFIFVFILVPLQNLELRQRTLGECLQRYQALNPMCNQSNRWARCQWQVTSWPGILKACEVQPALAFCHSAKLSVCVSHNLSLSLIYCLLSSYIKHSAFSNQKLQQCLRQALRQLRAKADRVIDRVFLPAYAILRVGIHTVCVWSAWERSTHTLLSSVRLSTDHDVPRTDTRSYLRLQPHHTEEETCNQGVSAHR